MSKKVLSKKSSKNLINLVESKSQINTFPYSGMQTKNVHFLVKIRITSFIYSKKY